MTIKRGSLALVLLALALPGTTIARDLDCKFSAARSASLDTRGIERVEIEARAGDLAVTPANGPTLVAEGRACASSEQLLAQTLLVVRRDGNVIRVVAQVPSDMKGIGLFYAALSLTVAVPATLAVAVTDSSGDITLDGVRVTSVTDSSGDLLLRRTPGDVVIDDSSGDVRVEDSAGAVAISDSSGDIIVRGARDVRIPRDSSGDIRIERVAGSVRIEQDSSGDISIVGVGHDVEVLGDSSGEVRVSDVKGTVRVP